MRRICTIATGWLRAAAENGLDVGHTPRTRHRLPIDDNDAIQLDNFDANQCRISESCS